jgi:hypothetical protein
LLHLSLFKLVNHFKLGIWVKVFCLKSTHFARHQKEPEMLRVGAVLSPRGHMRGCLVFAHGGSSGTVAFWD